MNYKVGYLLPAIEEVYSVIRKYLPAGFELVTLRSKDAGEMMEVLPNLDFLVSMKATREMIGQGSKLKLIQLPGVGYDQIDLEAAAARSIPVAVAEVATAEVVAELVMLLMLGVGRRLVEVCGLVRAGQWPMWERRLISFGLSGKRLGIVGFGRIGKQVARRAAAFDMDVCYYDVVRSDAYRFAPLDELLRTSDFVSLHVPLTPETRGLMDASRIAAMKPGAVLINTSRGNVVDEAALYAALKSGHLAGAGLDVFDPEPPRPDNPLLTLDQVIVTPHIGTGTLESLHARARFYAENFSRVVAGEQPVGLVKPVAN